MKNRELYLIIDLGGTTAKAAFFENEKIIHNFIIPTDINRVVENMYEHVIIECDKQGIDYENDIKFFGTTICGLIDYENGISLYSSNLNFLNYPIVKTIKNIFKKEEVYIMNDSKAATYGEWTTGIGKKYSSMFLYTIGTGIGGGLIYDNKLIFGTNSKIASEPGHGYNLQSKYNCNCGLGGCIEALSSATGIEKILNEKATKKGSVIKQLKDNLKRPIVIKDIVNLFNEDNSEIIDVLKYCLKPLAQHICFSMHLLDIELFLIGGGPSNLGDKLSTILMELCKTMMLPDFYKSLRIEIASLKNTAGLYGLYEWVKLKTKNNN